MTRQLLFLSLLPVFTFAAVGAPVPSPDKLLPADTIAVLTITDMIKSRASFAESAAGKLWNDPTIKPFREKLSAKFKVEITEPLEKELGIKFGEYSDLAQGQCTVAVALPETGNEPILLLLMDAGAKSEALKTKLAELKKKWVDGGKQLKTEKIRDVEFSTFMFSLDELGQSLDKALSGPKAGDGANKPATGRQTSLSLGQSGSLFVLGNSIKFIEKVLIRQSGGGVPSLSEQPLFAGNYNAMFRDSLAYGWVNTKSLIDSLMKKMPSSDEEPAQGGQMMPRPDKILNALGLTGLQTLALAARDIPEGSLVEFQANVPESVRKGLFKMIAFEARESSPPPFVPADAVKFSRIRLDLPKTWATLEQSLVEAMPQAAGVIKLLVDNAGKDKDPNFDLRQNLIANLGNDIVTYQKAPRKQTLQDLESPPALFLISSAKAEQLASAFKALGSIVPGRGSKVKEREFLGRTVYAMNFSLPGMQNQGGERTLHFSSSGGYVALSYDLALLEEYLRNSGTAPKALRETSGLAAAAQKVGGMNTGLFSYENQLETMRHTVEILKKESGSLSTLFGASPVASRLGLTDKDLQEWVDFSLLPPFEQIAKYFHFAVTGGTVNAEGFSVKIFSPVPPQMKK